MKYQMKKIKNYLLGLNFLRKFLGWQIFSGKFAKDLRLKILNRPHSGRVLVLAPHPDDEVFGCGGAIIKHINQGDKIKIAYLTGNSERRDEARDSNQILGVNDFIFLGWRDGEITVGQKEINIISSLILNFKPDLIYVPIFIDSHPDHQAMAEILSQTIKKIKFEGDIWSYEIWTPVPANRIIKIDDVFAQKVLAIKAYQSQLYDRGYLRAIKGLNSYRAGMFGAGKRAEAFFVCKAGLYQKILGFRV